MFPFHPYTKTPSQTQMFPSNHHQFGDDLQYRHGNIPITPSPPRNTFHVQHVSGNQMSYFTRPSLSFESPKIPEEELDNNPYGVLIAKLKTIFASMTPSHNGSITLTQRRFKLIIMSVLFSGDTCRDTKIGCDLGETSVSFLTKEASKIMQTYNSTSNTRSLSDLIESSLENSDIPKRVENNIKLSLASMPPSSRSHRQSIQNKRWLLTILSSLFCGNIREDLKIASEYGKSTRSLLTREASRIMQEYNLATNTKTISELIELCVRPKLGSHCMKDIRKKVVDEYCHDDFNAHRPDSSESRPVFVNNKNEWHVRRIWENLITWPEKYKDFQQSKQYLSFKTAYPDKDISCTMFRTNCCPCLKNSKHDSCVDLIMTQLEEYMIAIRTALRSRPILHENIRACNCVHHANRVPESVIRRRLDSNSITRRYNKKPRVINKTVVRREVNSLESIVYGKTL